MRSIFKYLLFVGGIAILFSSCYPVQFLAEDEHLLHSYNIEFKENPVKDLDGVNDYIYQKPNRTILGFIKFYLGMYAIFDMGSFEKDCSTHIENHERQLVLDELRKQREEKLFKDKLIRIKKNPKDWIKSEICRTRQWFMKTMGEEPVIYDKTKIGKSKEAIRLYLNNEGFYRATVDTLVEYKSRKRAVVTYSVKLNQPYYLKTISFAANNATMDSLIELNKSKTKLKTGQIFDLDDLKQERERLSRIFSDNGYYKFSTDYIVYKADTGYENGKYYVNLRLEVLKKKEQIKIGEYYKMEDKEHQRFTIRNIYINPDYDLRSSINSSINNSDTLPYANYRFIFQNEFVSAQYNDPEFLLKTMAIKPEKLIKNIYLKDSINNLYRIGNIEQTYKHLNSLRIFRLNTIDFAPVKQKNEKNEFQELDAYVLLKPATPQAFTVELEGSNFSTNFGIAGNFLYEHRNVLRSATKFSMKIKGAREKRLDVLDDNLKSFNAQEYQTEFRFTFPQLSPDFLLKSKTEKFRRVYNPKTSVSFSYLYRQHPNYTLDNISILYGYYWLQGDEITHYFNPFELSRVTLSNISDDFRLFLNLNPQLQASYEDHFISEINYAIVYNPINQQKRKRFQYIRFSVESAGTTLGLYNLLEGSTKPEGGYTIFNKPFAQFLKFDFDYRYFINLNKRNKLALRSYSAIGYAFGNSTSMPFGKKFYSGGANSLRAWQIRSLGPGAYRDTISLIPNQTGDIRLEMNLEYRTKLFWMLESAVFLDMGNIWNMYESEQVPNGHFLFKEFYKQFAIGTGLGLRFDFSFFIFRADIGLKLRDPSLDDNNKWIFTQRFFNKDDLNVSLSIGYPF